MQKRMRQMLVIILVVVGALGVVASIGTAVWMATTGEADPQWCWYYPGGYECYGKREWCQNDDHRRRAGAGDCVRREEMERRRAR